MNNYAFNIIHAVILIILQFLVFKNFSFPIVDRYLVLFLFYPLIIILLPLNTPKSVVVVAGFALGILADLFYASPGVHSSALVLMSFLRSPVLRVIEPRQGYRTDNLPTVNNYGLSWFLRYAAILLFIFILGQQCASVFTFFYLDKILVNSLLSFIISYIFVVLYQLIIKK